MDSVSVVLLVVHSETSVTPHSAVSYAHVADKERRATSRLSDLKGCRSFRYGLFSDVQTELNIESFPQSYNSLYNDYNTGL